MSQFDETRMLIKALSGDKDALARLRQQFGNDLSGLNPNILGRDIGLTEDANLPVVTIISSGNIKDARLAAMLSATAEPELAPGPDAELPGAGAGEGDGSGVPADPRLYTPEAWYTGTPSYWGNDNAFIHQPTMYDWLMQYQPAWEAAHANQVPAIAPSGMSGQYANNPEDFTRGFTDFVRDEGLFQGYHPAGAGGTAQSFRINPEALGSTLGLYSHFEHAPDTPFARAPMSQQEVDAVVARLVADPRVPDPQTDYATFRQAFDETAYFTVATYRNGQVPEATDAQIQTAIATATGAQGPLGPDVPTPPSGGYVPPTSTTYNGNVRSRPHVGSLNPALSPYYDPMGGNMGGNDAAPGSGATIPVPGAGGPGASGPGSAGERIGDAMTGGTLGNHRARQEAWDLAYNHYMKQFAGMTPEVVLQAANAYLAQNPPPDAGAATFYQHELDKAQEQTRAAAYGASGGLSSGGDSFNKDLGQHYTGQNYIQSSNGMVDAAGILNPDMASHFQALARMQAAEGVFDPDQVGHLAALRAINNPYALFWSWQNPLPEVDERWLEQYYLNYRPALQQGGNFLPSVRKTRVVSPRDDLQPKPPVVTRRDLSGTSPAPHSQVMDFSRALNLAPNRPITRGDSLPIHGSTDSWAGGGGSPIVRSNDIKTQTKPVELTPIMQRDIRKAKESDLAYV